MQAKAIDKEQATQTGVQDRSTEFVPVSGGQETTSAEALLIAAYLLMWAIVFGFIALTIKKQRHLDDRLGQLERQLARLDEAGSPQPGEGSRD